MKLHDLQRHKNTALSEIEQEEHEKAEYLQKKANQQRQEQEDEIKYLNEVRNRNLVLLEYVIMM